jgi:hypothetical protein
MAFVPSYKTRVLLGAMNLSCEIRNASIPWNQEAIDVTTLCETAPVFIPGMETATFSADGPLDVSTSTNDPYDILTDWKGTNLPLTYAPSGLTALGECWLLDVLQSSFASSNTLTGSADFSIAAQATGFPDAGTVLEDLTAITIDTNGTTRDLTAASANGGVAHLHVTAFSGLTNNIVTIEHSTTGVGAWATLATFATYTGVTSERVVVAAGTTVNRYLRVVDNVTGSGSTTRAVAFSRR